MNPLEWWQNIYGEIAPVGHVLREHFHDNWVRFHSLPKSKRYPDTPEENEEILHRHVEVANYLFQREEVIFIYKSRFHVDGDGETQRSQLVGVDLSTQAVLLRAYPGEIALEDDDVFLVRGLKANWMPAYFSEIVRQVANEEEHLISFVSPDSRNIYCPYDGGMDTFSFSTSPAKIDKRFSQWKSARPDGM